MSWNVSLIEIESCPHCHKKLHRRHGESREVRNVTYNNSKIFRALGVHPDQLSAVASAWIIPLEKALIEIQKNRLQYVHLEPSNCWGGIDDSIDFMEKLLEKCRMFPHGEVDWS